MNEKIKILQVVALFDYGGIENWLVDFAKKIDKDLFQIDILVHRKGEGVNDELMKLLGITVFYLSGNPSLLSFRRELLEILRQKKYDIVHTHMHHYSGWIAFIANHYGVKKIVAHSHTDIRNNLKKESFLKKIYRLCMFFLIKRYVSEIIAVTNETADSLLNNRSSLFKNLTILPAGRDLAPFLLNKKKFTRLHNEFNIDKNNKIVLHISNFSNAKNQRFSIEIFENLVKESNTIKAFFIGDGINRGECEKIVKEKSLSNKIFFTGSRSDIIEILSECDVAILPSLWEGFPLVVIELQASMVPLIISERVTNDSIVVSKNVKKINLSDGAKVWADTVLEFLNTGSLVKKKDIVKFFEASSLDFDKSILKIENIYKDI